MCLLAVCLQLQLLRALLSLHLGRGLFTDGKDDCADGAGSFLFCGGGWSESSSSATDLQSMEAAGATYDIGFRATKVTVDRSGWFDTTVLSNTQSMNKVSLYAKCTVNQYPATGLLQLCPSAPEKP